MFLSEPDRSDFDWNFRFWGCDVRVHPFFWLVTFFMGRSQDPMSVLVWIAAVFLSILIHEIGHVWAMRRCGFDGDVVLYGFGGLAIPRRGFARSARNQVLISAAGPGAGFVLAFSVCALVVAIGGQVVYFPAWGVIPNWYAFVAHGDPETATVAARYLGLFVNDILWCSIFWGFMNLLPVLPLDGGHISEALLVGRIGEQGRVRAYQVSFVMAVVVTLVAAIEGSTYLAFFFASMAFGSFQYLQNSTTRWRRYD